MAVQRWFSTLLTLPNMGIEVTWDKTLLNMGIEVTCDFKV